MGCGTEKMQFASPDGFPGEKTYPPCESLLQHLSWVGLNIVRRTGWNNMESGLFTCLCKKCQLRVRNWGCSLRGAAEDPIAKHMSKDLGSTINTAAGIESATTQTSRAIRDNVNYLHINSHDNKYIPLSQIQTWNPFLNGSTVLPLSSQGSLQELLRLSFSSA